MRLHVFVLLISALSAAGCGGSGSPSIGGDVPLTGPHGGPVVTLPGGTYAEVVLESPGTGGAVVAAYFFADNALSTPAADPMNVRFVMEFPDREPVPLDLKAAPGTGTAEQARFVSGPAPDVVDTLVGTLSATVGGQEATVSVVSPR